MKVSLFRIGPVVMLVPVIVWATGWYHHRGPFDAGWYVIWPMYFFILLTVFWHAALLVFGKHRLTYLIYAIFHLPAFYYIWGWSMICATHFPL